MTNNLKDKWDEFIKTHNVIEAKDQFDKFEQWRTSEFQNDIELITLDKYTAAVDIEYTSIDGLHLFRKNQCCAAPCHRF